MISILASTLVIAASWQPAQMPPPPPQIAPPPVRATPRPESPPQVRYAVPPNTTVSRPPPPKPAPRARNPGRWITSSDYPAISMLMNEEGSSTFRLTVGQNGRVPDCRITRASGFKRLDDLTCRLVERRARFYPALSPDGHAVASEYTQTVRWMMAEAGPLRATQFGWRKSAASREQRAAGTVRFEFWIGKDGKVFNSRVMEGSGFESLDRDTCAALKSMPKQEPARDSDGSLQARRVVTSVRW